MLLNTSQPIDVPYVPRGPAAALPHPTEEKPMNRSAFSLLLALLLAAASCATAQPAAPEPPAEAPADEQQPPPPGDWSVTDHTVTIAGEEVAYTATAGTI